MADDLIEHFERLAWARDETKSLDAEIATFLATRPYQLEEVFTAPLRIPRKHVIATSTAAIPRGIIIRTGCIVNELRSILDALACTLAERNSKTPNGVSFPIADDENGYNTDRGIKDKIAKISAADRIALRALTPWDGPTGNQLLHSLHHADITRKHRRLIYMTPVPDGGGILAGTHIVEGTLFPFQGGDMSKGVVVADLTADSKINLQLNVLLCFSEPPFLKGKQVVTMLNGFAAVVDECLKLFN